MPDGKYIASASNDGTVQVWDAVTGHRMLTYQESNQPVITISWSADGTRIASEDATRTDSGNNDEVDAEIKVWDVADVSQIKFSLSQE